MPLVLRMKVTRATAAEIRAWLIDIDESGAAEALPQNPAYRDIVGYYTRKVIAGPEGAVVKTPQGVKRYKPGQLVRGPLAESVSEGISQQTGAEKFRWQAVLDENTGERDRELDGTVWRYDDPLAPIPPLHFGCRCQRIPVAGSERAMTGKRTRAATIPEGGLVIDD
jgi:hypothetical protein